MGKRLINFLSSIILQGIVPELVSAHARQQLFRMPEQDTAVYCYGPYEEPERHSEADLVVKFMSDNGCHVHASWQGTSVTISGNFPSMGWDYDDGEFGLGGDWWQNN